MSCPEDDQVGAATGPSRFNIIFHGVMVYRVNENGITVHLPRSEDSKGKSVHEYRLKWKAQSSEGNYQLPGLGDQDPFLWLDLPKGTQPVLHDQDHLIFPDGSRVASRNTHVCFKVPHPHSVMSFRYAMAPQWVFAEAPMDQQENPLARNPVRLGFPVIFSYVDPHPSTRLFFRDLYNDPVSIHAYDGGNPVNVHIHAAPPGCAHSDHIFVNNEALYVDDAQPLDLSYAALDDMRCTLVDPYDPALSLIGLEPSDLLENCELSPPKQGHGHDDRDKAGVKTNPPDACFGMWVFDK